MSVDEVLISDLGAESRAAFLESGSLRRLVVSQPDDGPAAGDVVLGRVVKVVAPINAAFVDIGFGRDGFLGHPDVRPMASGGGRITDFLSEGDTVLVQVQNEPAAGKGAKLTARPSLPGRTLVFLPGQPGVRLSRRISDPAERSRLADAVAALSTENGGWIVRGIAGHVPVDTVAAEARRLLEAWSKVEERRATARAPARLLRGSGAVLAAVIEESGRTFHRVIADSSRRLAETRSLMPDLAQDWKLHTDARSLFDAYGIEERIQELLRPEIPLPSGGRIEIAETAAVIAIDVDTGAASRGDPEETAFRVNLEAADAVARHIRLRDLAGHLVIDFVPMQRRANRSRLVSALRRGLEQDHRPFQLAGYTPFGLVELTRQRRERSLRGRLTTACPACEGDGRVRSPTVIAHEALRRIQTAARTGAGPAFAIAASPSVAAAWRGAAAAAVSEVEERLGISIVVRETAALGPEDFEVIAVRPGEE